MGRTTTEHARERVRAVCAALALICLLIDSEIDHAAHRAAATADTASNSTRQARMQHVRRDPLPRVPPEECARAQKGGVVKQSAVRVNDQFALP